MNRLSGSNEDTADHMTIEKNIQTKSAKCNTKYKLYKFIEGKCTATTATDVNNIKTHFLF